MRGVQHRLDCSEPELVEEPLRDRVVTMRCPECRRAGLVSIPEQEEE